MGDPKRARKKYTTPRHPWRKERISEESKLQKDYGLKSKREIWRHITQLRKYRERARRIASMTGPHAEQLKKELFSTLSRAGVLQKETPLLDDVLSLTLKDMLERRLQTFVQRRGMAFTQRQARQFITHGHVAVGGKRVTVPSFIVEKGMESKISFTPGSNISATHSAVPQKARQKGAPSVEARMQPKKEQIAGKMLNAERGKGAGASG